MRLELRDIDGAAWAVLEVSHAGDYTEEITETVVRRLMGVWMEDEAAVVDSIAVYDAELNLLGVYTDMNQDRT